MAIHTMTVHQLSSIIGAEIHGVEPSQPLDDDTFQAMHDAWMDHQVIFFRDQHLTVEQHKAFGRRFGDLHVHPAAPSLVEGHPDILVIHADEHSTRVGLLPAGTTRASGDGTRRSAVFPTITPDAAPLSARIGGRVMLRLGAVAYAPYVVTIFEGIKRHCHQQGVELDWVLYSNYDALVTAFVAGEVDLAWNGPLAYVKIRRALGEACKNIAMRDIDVGLTTQFITQTDAPVHRLEDLRGKRVALASRASVEAGLLPYHYLKQAGLDPERDLTCSTHEERPPTQRRPEAAVVDLVASGAYDAGAVSAITIDSLRAQGRFPDDRVRVFWRSPGYSHCVFTAQSTLDEALANQVTEALVSMRYDDPTHKAVLDLEHCRAFVPGTTEGFDTLEQAAQDEGLIA